MTRWDCIAINNKAVSENDFRSVENYFIELNEKENIKASEFELLTATAFKLFADKNVDIGIIEVGMGGKLDATNILENQIISVISKIAYDHQGFLGDTIEEIAAHKAGILRPKIPFIVNPKNTPSVIDVIEKYAAEIGAGRRLLPGEEVGDLYKTANWHKFATGKLPFQRDNAVMAYVAYLEALKFLGLKAKDPSSLLADINNVQPIRGRLQSVYCPLVLENEADKEILVDGAHNPDAAYALDAYVEKKLSVARKSKHHPEVIQEDVSGTRRSITWVLAMTEGKDAREYLRILLRPGDHVVTTSFGPVDGMPWVKSMDPETLLKVAQEVLPGIPGVAVPQRSAYRALCAARYMNLRGKIVLTGSLYLMGDFFREHSAAEAYRNGSTKESKENFFDMAQIHKEERLRISSVLN